MSSSRQRSEARRYRQVTELAQYLASSRYGEEICTQAVYGSLDYEETAYDLNCSVAVLSAAISEAIVYHDG